MAEWVNAPVWITTQACCGFNPRQNQFLDISFYFCYCVQSKVKLFHNLWELTLITRFQVLKSQMSQVCKNCFLDAQLNFIWLGFKHFYMFWNFFSNCNLISCMYLFSENFRINSKLFNKRFLWWAAHLLLITSLRLNLYRTFNSCTFENKQ